MPRSPMTTRTRSCGKVTWPSACTSDRAMTPATTRAPAMISSRSESAGRIRRLIIVVSPSVSGRVSAAMSGVSTPNCEPASVASESICGCTTGRCPAAQLWSMTEYGDGLGLDVRRALAGRVDGEVRFDAGSRAAYSTDGSNFRQVPLGVVLPRSTEAVVETVAVCREYDLPVVSRGGGTSLAGQCTNQAIVIDFSKYCNALVDVDVGARRCVVEPGIVLDDLNQRLERHGLRFGPEPATHMNCTLGGMIGNNSCGATAQRTGKVVDNIASLDVLLYDG